MKLDIRRRQLAHLLAIALGASTLATSALAHHHDDDDDDGSTRRGKVFISTNAPVGNEVLVYQRNANGPATLLSRVATQGRGTGAGLGSQGAVTLSSSGRYLFVVNAQSNTLSTFELGRDGLVLASVVNSGGLTPTSVAENDGLVYVLNAGGSGNVAGFRNVRGTLTPLSDGVRGLSAAGGTAPAQVSFDRDGDALVVSERNTNVLSSYTVKRDGTLSNRLSTRSSGQTPFGFAITNRNQLIVSEAQASTVSSYRINEHPNATLQLLTGSVPTTQAAACWVAVTPNGNFAFVSNAASSSISSLRIASNGSLSLLAARAGTTGGGALDLAVSPGGHQLHVFASGALRIVSFTIDNAGGLTPLGSVAGMPAGSAGLAVN